MTSTPIAPHVTPALQDLVHRVRAVVAEGLSPAATARSVAQSLQPSLAEPELLLPDQQEGSPDGYLQHLLHVEPDGSFSIVSLVWLPGQSTPIHDHVSWCTVGVYRGQETEVQYRKVGHGPDAALVVKDQFVNDRGSVTGISPPGDIHSVRNTGAGSAISLHVYGADVGKLGSSIRRVYGLPVRT